MTGRKKLACRPGGFDRAARTGKRQRRLRMLPAGDADQRRRAAGRSAERDHRHRAAARADADRRAAIDLGGRRRDARAAGRAQLPRLCAARARASPSPRKIRARRASSCAASTPASVGSTVATYVDDTPFGASGSLSNGAILAGDFDTFDVARIEVLRGPQGTLYGTNALGGVLKFVTAAPSTERFEARAQAGVEDTRYGEIGYSGNAMVNVPLGDTLAFRASGFYRDNGGYLDAPARGGRNVNGSDSYGGRASLLFKPTDDLSVRLFALLQNIETDLPVDLRGRSATLGRSTRSPELLSARRTARATSGSRSSTSSTTALYAGTIDYDFGFATLTSVTSYSEQTRDELGDISTNAAFRGLANLFYAPTAPGTVGAGVRERRRGREVHPGSPPASPDNDRFEWLVGGYYTDEKTALIQEILPVHARDAGSSSRPAVTFRTVHRSAAVSITLRHLSIADYEEIAGFASATLKFGDRFDITAGGRYSHNEQSSDQPDHPARHRCAAIAAIRRKACSPGRSRRASSSTTAPRSMRASPRAIGRAGRTSSRRAPARTSRPSSSRTRSSPTRSASGRETADRTLRARRRGLLSRLGRHPDPELGDSERHARSASTPTAGARAARAPS